MTATTERVQRKDVARNRQRLLEAARVVFAERGLDATLDDVARHAGVGSGTAYRHFHSRNEVVSAILADVVQTVTADAEAAVSSRDAWAALVGFVEAFTERHAANRALHQVFAGGREPAIDPDDWSALLAAMSAVLDRARDVGGIRDDIGLGDLVGLFITLGPLYDLGHALGEPVWRRHIDAFLRGIRRDSTPSGAAVPPAVDFGLLVRAC